MQHSDGDFIDTESRLIVAREEQAEGLGEKVKKLRSPNWELQNSHGGVKHSIGNIVNKILITMGGASWVLDIAG